MTAGVVTPYRSGLQMPGDGFPQLLRAEWTKLRTVRGWVVGMILAALLTVGVGLLSHGECGIQIGGAITTGGAGCTLPLGPGGEAVSDSFYFVHQPLAGNGAITVRLTSMTAPQPWSKAGIIIKASTKQGSAYAAVMVTGSHGVRMQWDYTQDAPGLAGAVAAAAPRWLRLTRAGGSITGYDSADGTHWTKVGTATLAGLPAIVQAGLFAASPDSSSVTSTSIGGGSGSGNATQATAAFDHVTRQGTWPAGAWSGTTIGGAGGPGPVQGGAYRRLDSTGGGLSVVGSGDIAPEAPQSGHSVNQTLIGTFAGLIAVIIVGTMFMTAEYRRGLIRVTLTASPRRTRVLAAKAVVIGLTAFVAGLPAAFAALLIGEQSMRSRGEFPAPVTALTDVRLIAGTAALLAVTAILALGIGALLRRSAAAVTAVIVVIVLPYFFAGPLAVLPVGAANWLLRVTPAAGFAIQQPYPRYPQVIADYTPGNGYYPLAPWAGFAVLCAWAVLALAAAAYLLRRRDA